MKLQKVLSTLALTLTLAACGTPMPIPDSGTGGGSGTTDGGFFASFTAPSTAAVNNSVLLTVSGETSATEGLAFPPSAGDSIYFQDGWEVTFQHALVTIGAVTASEGPDTNPADQSVTGPVVAEAVGPWAVDLAKAGPLDAKEQNGKAYPLTRVANQNKKTGTPAFDATTKYAFGFSLIAAGQGAQNVNLDADAQAAYQVMAQKGWTVWFKGTATWKGNQSTPACRSTNPAYDFNRVPKVVNFAFGYKAPVNYKNCLNPDLQPVDSRGFQTATNTQTIAQVTFHLDHPFWEALTEDAPLRWDVLAARKSVATGMAPAMVDVTEADLAFDFLAPKDAQMNAVPWRTCGPVSTGERSTGTVSYDPATVPLNPAGGAAGLKDLADYMTYNLSTFGHLNNDGLCFPERLYPSPP